MSCCYTQLMCLSIFFAIAHRSTERQGFRYAGLQLKDHMNTKSLVVSRVVLCFCGNSYGRHGPVERCSEPCPKTTSVDVKMAAVVERKMAIVGRVGADLRTEICGNVLANIVIYVFFGERYRGSSVYISARN